MLAIKTAATYWLVATAKPNPKPKAFNRKERKCAKKINRRH
jgi:hypothetical protein